MSAQNPTPAGDPALVGPPDPEHDPRASYALEPEYVAALTARLVATSGTHRRGALAAQRRPAGAHPAVDAERRRRRRSPGPGRPSSRGRAPRSTTAPQMLLRLHDLVLDRQDEIIDLIVLETGKARKHAFDEPLHVALTARYYGRTARRHLEHPAQPGRRSRSSPAPRSTGCPRASSAIISPWNYPLQPGAHRRPAPRSLAGNAVVHKPDTQTPADPRCSAPSCSSEAGIPADLWQVVTGPGPEIGGAIIERADYVCFTGSTATGRLIAQQACADRLIGCSLELGGKNPMLVLRDADIEKAAEGAVAACFSSAGQLCVSIERMFVADQVYDRFVERFVARTAGADARRRRSTGATTWAR